MLLGISSSIMLSIGKRLQLLHLECIQIKTIVISYMKHLIPDHCAFSPRIIINFFIQLQIDFFQTILFKSNLTCKITYLLYTDLFQTLKYDFDCIRMLPIKVNLYFKLFYFEIFNRILINDFLYVSDLLLIINLNCQLITSSFDL